MQMQNIAIPFVCFRNYMNDSFRTDVFVRFSPETIACACIYLAARKLQISLPNSPPWWLLMGADEAEMQRISKTILSLYNRKKVSLQELLFSRGWSLSSSYYYYSSFEFVLKHILNLVYSPILKSLKPL